MPTHVRRPDPPSYPHSDHELTPDEVREQYGPLLDRFYAALHEDGQYLADVVTAVMKACEQRDRFQARMERYRQAKAEREAAVSR